MHFRSVTSIRLNGSMFLKFYLAVRTYREKRCLCLLLTLMDTVTSLKLEALPTFGTGSMKDGHGMNAFKGGIREMKRSGAQRLTTR